ncbi:hypothetical protein NQ314_001016 [Rhamnusium bicolor]|uniref:Uncharacterized protein n=1 Tax=Rhamnusium bicolor TaxID=1586634 RepID=A0AAV8ZWF4_9CUCU|nr:hypothetical protein NQ314_001016 [Rhamnusium bicolor]
MADLQAPVRVSPLIKVFFMVHFTKTDYPKKEAAFREIDAIHQAERATKLAAEKKLASDREMQELEAMAK